MVNVPRYSELNVEAIWGIVKEKQNIARCLPDYTKSQLPERNYLLNIIATVDEDFLMKIVNHAHKLRLPKTSTNDNDKIQIRNDILEEINDSSLISSKHIISKSFRKQRKSSIFAKEIIKTQLY